MLGKLQICHEKWGDEKWEALIDKKGESVNKKSCKVQAEVEVVKILEHIQIHFKLFFFLLLYISN